MSDLPVLRYILMSYSCYDVCDGPFTYQFPAPSCDSTSVANRIGGRQVPTATPTISYYLPSMFGQATTQINTKSAA